MPITLFLASYAGLSGIASCARRGSRSGALQPSGERLLWPCRSARRSARFGPDLELRHTSVGGGRNASLVAKAPTVEVGPAPRVRRPGASVQLGVAGSAAGPFAVLLHARGPRASRGPARLPAPGSPLQGPPALVGPRGDSHPCSAESDEGVCVRCFNVPRCRHSVLWPEPPRDRAGRHGREGREFTSLRGLRRTLPSSSLTRRCPRAEQLPAPSCGHASEFQAGAAGGSGPLREALAFLTRP